MFHVELETESDDHREKKGKAQSKLEEWKVQLPLLILNNDSNLLGIGER